MTLQKDWALKGVCYEGCRMNGQCPLWFGRDIWDEPCTSLGTWEVKEGHIGGVDMKGIIIMYLQDGIGPKAADLARGPREGAAYISDNTTAEQRKVLEPFVTTHLGVGAKGWGKTLGVKVVKINISQQDRIYHIIMPFGEQKFTLTVGGNGKTPIRLENTGVAGFSDIKVCNTDWKYSDYGKSLEFRQTSSQIADFDMRGTL